MNESMLLSIIIPVYNAAGYLPQCIDSILAAELTDAEIILVDDGSTDYSLSLCRSYENRYPNIRVLHQENAGPSKARNYGLSEAKGEYVAFFDSDDYIDSSAFAHRAELLKQYEADVWFSDFHRVADNGCVLDRVYQIKETEKPILDKKYLTEFLKAKDCVWNTWRCIFRKYFLTENNLTFAEGYQCAEDLQFMVRVLRCCQKYAFYHEPYYYYQINYTQSLTRDYSLRRVQHLITMMNQSEESLGGGEASRILGEKLAREYILNLSLLYAVPEKDYEKTLKALESGKHLLKYAGGIYKIAALFTRLLGIRTCGWILDNMKLVKQICRSFKVAHYQEKENK